MRIQFPDDVEFDPGQRQAVQRIADAAEAEVRALLPALAADVTIAVTIGGPMVIPETGDGGASYAPGVVLWAVDPSQPGGIVGVAERNLRWTLFHELHHQVRGWVITGGPPPTSFLHGVVSEGLATAFARDAAGHPAPWSDYPDDVEDWVRELQGLDLGADYGQWMFFHPDGRRWIGYRAGTFNADRAIEASGRSAADLVDVPTPAILELAGY